MGRLLFFVLLAAVIYFAWRWLRASQSRPPQAGAAPPEAATASEPMVRCAHCGVHLPRSTALPRGEHYYCCEEHRQAAPPA
jgi:uncharacterized protein